MDDSITRPSGARLLGPTVIVLHSVLMSPVIGATFAAINYHRVHDRRGLRRTVVSFVIPSAIMMLWATTSEPRFERIAHFTMIGWTLLVTPVLYVEQRAVVQKHVDAGGALVRWYLASLVAFVLSMAYLGVLSMAQWAADTF